MKVELKSISMPKMSENVNPVDLTTETMNGRLTRLLKQMEKNNLDTFIVYADREHGANFEYFTGFVPRFEEALLVIHRCGEAYLLLGNENTKMVKYARLQAKLIHVPFFSLPNQSMEDDTYLVEIFKKANISEDSRVALAGWKNFTSSFEDNSYLFDVPYFIVDALKKVIKNDKNLINGCSILISPGHGIRTVNNANELAHYEYGATLAGNGVLKTMNNIVVGKTELELANELAIDGQPNNVVTICATGERFTNATLYPRNKKVNLGDRFSASVGYKGGLSSRAGYVANDSRDLPEDERDYEEILAKPYYNAVVTWLEKVKVNEKAVDVYGAINDALPQEIYNWKLNPGHYVADEEWMSSPFYPNSEVKLRSGQLFQIDIIPTIAGYGGVGCEDGIALADEQLRSELAAKYPETWARILRRRGFLKDRLGINISDDILPLNDIVGYYRPYLLNHDLAFSR